jgi:ParB-like nuclease domain.
MKQIPFDELVCLERHKAESVRPLTGTGFITELRHSIHKLGIINALVVYKLAGKKMPERYLVVQGVRRMEALKINIMQGKGNKRMQIPCVVLEGKLNHAKMKAMRDAESRWFPKESPSTMEKRVERGTGTPSMTEKVNDNLFPYQREMIKELVARGKLDLKGNSDIGKGRRVYVDIENQNGGPPVYQYVGDVHDESMYSASRTPERVAAKNADGDESSLLRNYQSLNRAARIGRPVKWVTINTAGDMDSWVKTMLEEKQRIYEEFTMGYHMRHVNERFFDLGDNW